jgi:hypothetical protein
VPGSAEEIADSHLRYSYASIVFDASTSQLVINVESYASALFSRLEQQQSIIFDGQPLTTGLNANQKLCLTDSTIYKQNPASQAYVKDAQGNMLIDSFNQSLSALRSCGLLNSILERIKLEIFDTQDSATYTALAARIDTFKNSANVKAILTPDGPGVVQTELSLSRFLKIINNNCP